MPSSGCVITMRNRTATSIDAGRLSNPGWRVADQRALGFGVRCKDRSIRPGDPFGIFSELVCHDGLRRAIGFKR